MDKEFSYIVFYSALKEKAHPFYAEIVVVYESGKVTKFTSTHVVELDEAGEKMVFLNDKNKSIFRVYTKHVAGLEMVPLD